MRLNPYACHCTDCQSRTGSAFSEHMLIAEQDIEITGELDIGEYDQPSGARSQMLGCKRCKVRIYAVNDSQKGFASLRCGTLDGSETVVPAAHIWVKSKQPWITLSVDTKAMDNQPRETTDWIDLLGFALR